MSSHKQQGFTLVELLITIIMVGVVGTIFLVAFKSTLFNYLNMQHDASSTTQISTQAYRIATVIRSATDITSAANNDLVVYAYFYPSDSYVSLLHYYLTTDAKGTRLMADLTPMTANPPIGTTITSQKRTFTIIDSFYTGNSKPLFEYLNAGGSTLPLPISDLQTIKGIRVNLAAKGTNGSNQTLNVDVSLRNRKTNL